MIRELYGITNVAESFIFVVGGMISPSSTLAFNVSIEKDKNQTRHTWVLNNFILSWLFPA